MQTRARKRGKIDCVAERIPAWLRRRRHQCSVVAIFCHLNAIVTCPLCNDTNNLVNPWPIGGFTRAVVQDVDHLCQRTVWLLT
jgi:hypothetical protein